MNKLLFILPIVGYGLFLILSQDAAGGGQLELNLQPSPEIFLFNDRVLYQSPTDYFIAKGQPLFLSDDNQGNHSIQSNLYAYTLEASIDSSGTLSSGTIQINGTIPDLGFNSGILLTGDLTQIGFGNSELDPLEFKFVITSGDASSLFGGIGSTGGVVFSHLISPSTFETSFMKSQDTSRVGIPEGLGGQTNGETKPESEIVKPESETTPESSLNIPDWIKNNAEWWADDLIGDSDFVSGIQYLINEGIMKIPSTTPGSGTGSDEIPPWIKNNAEWWANNQISDNEFVSGIQYLIENGIMKLA